MQTIETKLKLFLDQIGKGQATLSEDLIQEFGEKCKDVLRKVVAPVPDSNPFRASNIGRPLCQIQMEQSSAPREPNGYDFPMKMMIGDVIEAIILTFMKASGIEMGATGAKTEFKIDGTSVPGHIDVEAEGKVWDIKSASPYAFSSKFNSPDGFKKMLDDDPFGYIGQGYVYSEGYGKPFGGWIAVNKVTGEIAVLEVPVLDEKVREQVLSNISNSVRAVKEKAPFKRCYEAVDEFFYGKKTGNKTLGVTCSYCAYKKTCWAAEGLTYTANPKSKAENPKKSWYVGRVN